MRALRSSIWTARNAIAVEQRSLARRHKWPFWRVRRQAHDLGAERSTPRLSRCPDEGGTETFWSADSQFIAFSARKAEEGCLKRRPAQVWRNSQPMPISRTWNADIDLIGSDGAGPLLRVRGGGQSAPATELIRTARKRRTPIRAFLPDGKHYFYLARSNIRSAPRRVLWVISSKERVTLRG